MPFETVKPTAADKSLAVVKKTPSKRSSVPKVPIMERPGYGPFNLAKGAKVDRIITETEEALEWLRKETGWIALDFETSGLDVWHNMVTVFGAYGPEFQTAVVLHIQGLWPESLLAWLNEGGHKFITHNGATFDILYLVAAGVDVSKSTFYDTMIVEQVVTGTVESAPADDGISDLGLSFPTARARVPANLQATVKRRLGVDIAKDVDYRSWVTDELTTQQIRYVAEDISFLPAIRVAQINKANDNDTRWGKNQFYGTGLVEAVNLELQLMPSVIKMESRGLPMDLEALEVYYETQKDVAERTKVKLDELFGEINWNSHAQIKAAFKRVYGSELLTTKEAHLKDLAELMVGTPVGEGCGLIVKYRHAVKRSGMYNRDFFDKFTVDGWLRGRFKQCGTDTGRFSSSDPNLQQLPKNKGNNDGARHIIGNHPDFDIVAIDYSQIEVRIAANEAEDTALIELLQTDDIHRMIASRVFGIPPEEVTKDQRQLSKAMSFCLIFGGGAFTLTQYAKQYGADLPIERARPIIVDFFDQFRGLKAMKDRAIRIANAGRPYTINLPTGLRRTLIPGVNLKPTLLLNNIVQGTAAAGLKYALIEAQKEGLDDYLGAVVHDEIVSAVPKAYSQEFADKLMDCMIRGMQRVCEIAPVKAEASIGETWG